MKGDKKMMTYSRWNDPKMYARVTDNLVNIPIPTEPVFAVKSGERIVRSPAGFRAFSSEELSTSLDEIDRAILESVALSKYLTSLQIFEYISLRGYDVNRPRLRRRVLKLMKFRVIQEKEMVIPGAERGIKFYELDYFGYLLARESGIVFHMGNRYVSYSKRFEAGMPDVTPYDVKRILAGNQIVIGLLLSNAKMERFGIMETMRVCNQEQAEDGCMIRTAANIRIDHNATLAYEVVRDTPEAYEKLKNKVERYYCLVNNIEYLKNNYHGDSVYPQLIVCGETYAHNMKIASFLKECGMWRKQNSILFTEDLLNIKNSLTSIYGLNDDNSQCWYSLPCRYSHVKEIA